MASKKKVDVSVLADALKERFGELSDEQLGDQLSALGSCLKLSPEAVDLTESQYKLALQILDLSVTGQAKDYMHAKQLVEEGVDPQNHSQVQMDEGIAHGDEVPSEIQLIANVAGVSASETIQALADQGSVNVEQARQAFNVLYTQQLRELVNSGELERKVVSVREDSQSSRGKSIGLLEQAQQLVASRNSSKALPEGSSD